MKKFVFKEARLLALRKQEVTIAELAAARVSEQVGEVERQANLEADAIDALSARIMSRPNAGFTHITQTAVALQVKLSGTQKRLRDRKSELTTALSTLLQAKVKEESLRALEKVRIKNYKSAVDKDLQAELDSNAARAWMMEERVDHD